MSRQSLLSLTSCSTPSAMGLGRLTYAHADALGLIRTYWPFLRRWRDSIESDLRLAMSDVLPGRKDGCQELLDWIETREAGDE